MKAKENLWDFDFFFVSVACGCGLCLPDMIITKANAKENLGEFMCLGGRFGYFLFSFQFGSGEKGSEDASE